MTLSAKTAMVVGLGDSGLASVELLRAEGVSVVVNDLRDQATLGERYEKAQALGATFVLGSHSAAPFTDVDLIVVSPGVPPLAELDAAEAAGVPIYSEVELASRFIEGDIIAITGTNGKSTVTTLIASMCRATGRPTFEGGNLGTPLAAAVKSDAARAGGFVVVELSSFQLERIVAFRPKVSVLLNVTPDHLDRYPSEAAYAEAKARIFMNQTAEDWAILPSGDELAEAVCRDLAKGVSASVRTFGDGDQDAARVGPGEVRLPDGTTLHIDTRRLPGGHNAKNVAAAAAAVACVGVDAGAMQKALDAFTGLPHRMQFVRELNGVRYYDDSKATNVGAVEAALSGLSAAEGSVIVIAGGKHKGASYDTMVARLKALGGRCILIGEAAPLIAESLKAQQVPYENAASMAEAVQLAAEGARPKDLVLLSPACSSFDMFRSYGERGDVYQALVRELPPAIHSVEAP